MSNSPSDLEQYGLTSALYPIFLWGLFQLEFNANCISDARCLASDPQAVLHHDHVVVKN